MQTYAFINVFYFSLYESIILTCVSSENFSAGIVSTMPNIVVENEKLNVPPPPILLYHINEYANSSVLQDGFKRFVSTFTNEIQSKIISNQLKYCPFTPLCTSNWVIAASTSITFCCEQCRCDPDCDELGICCPDIIPTNKYNLEQTPHHLKCLAKTLKPDPLFTLGVFAYTTCPNDADTDLRDMCTRHYKDATTLHDIVPVIDTNNVTYRNTYCAQCNHANNTEFWTPKITCKEKSLSFETEEEVVEVIFNYPKCNMHFEAPNENAISELNQCKVVVSTCNVTGLWSDYNVLYEWACGLYYSPVTKETTLYQNIFCVLCNGFEDVDNFCSHRQLDGDELHSFAVVLDVRPYEESIQPCEAGFVKARDKCIKASCSSVRVLTGDSCEPILDKVLDSSYKLSFRLVPEQIIHTYLAYDAVHSVIELIKFIIGLSSGDDAKIKHVQGFIFTNKLYHTNMTVLEVFNTSIRYIDIQFKFRVKSNHTPEYILQELKNITEDPISVGQDKQFVIHIKSDPDNKYEQIEQESLQSIRGPSNIYILLEKLPDQNTENEFTKIGYTQTDFDGQYDATNGLTYSYVDMLSMVDCPFVKVSKDRFPWTESTTGLRFGDEGFPLKFSEFLYSTNTSDIILVCLEKYLDIQDFTFPKEINWAQRIESIVSLVCVSLSIVCLLFTCITFIFLPSFKTLPWRNNLALTLSLLLAQIMYLLSTYIQVDKQSIGCKVLGLMLHFFLLLFTFWMNICAFHMYRVLTSTKLVSQACGRKTFCLYATYSIVLSASFITLNVLYSSYGKTTEDIGYGGTVCYINSQFMIILTFGLPLILVLVSNFALISIVIHKIRKTSKIQKNVKNDTNIMNIIAKLTVITGITWVFGILHMFISHPVFSYLFVIINGSQGVFLMVSFVLNKKTIVLYKETLSGTFNKSVHSSAARSQADKYT